MSQDPWRVTEPLATPPPAKSGERINLGDDLDNDLRVAAEARLECRGGVIKVTSFDMQNQSDALHRVIGCLRGLWEAGARDLFDYEDIRVKDAQGSFGCKSQEDTAVAVLETDDAQGTVYFVNSDFETGMVKLIRMLGAARRRKPNVLEKWGVVPILR